MNILIESLQNLIREPYAWPGGYARIAILSDGEALCPACCKENYRRISYSTRHNLRDGWSYVGPDTMENYQEGDESDDCCAHCNMRLAAL